jgi:FkbM family methyltransferase
MEGHTFIGNWITPRSVIIDCGMNEGVFARRVMSKYGCRVVGIEANPGLAEQNRTDRRLECHNFAVCGCEGVVKFQVDHVHSMNSRIVDDVAVGPDIVEVPGSTIETIVPLINVTSIDLLKLDIEGAEIEVIETASPEFFTQIPQIAVEFHAFLDKSKKSAAIKSIKTIESVGFASFDFSMNLGNVLFVNRRFYRTSFLDNGYFAFEKYRSGIRRTITKTHE